jgi:hypothetical protein
MNIYEVTYRDGEYENYVGNMRIVKCRIIIIENGWNDIMINIKDVKHVIKWKIPELFKDSRDLFYTHLKENRVRISQEGSDNIYEGLNGIKEDK